MSRHLKIPDRWESYSPIGEVVVGTQFIPFKNPLNAIACRKLQNGVESFTVSDLLSAIPRLGLVIDLTNVSPQRRYDPSELHAANVRYHKVRCAGHGEIPSKEAIRDFMNTVDNFLAHPGNVSRDGRVKLIGVHCTHGINRTGFFICKYMIERMQVLAHEALDRFKEARGYAIERDNYIHEIMHHKIAHDTDSTVEEVDKHKRRKNVHHDVGAKVNSDMRNFSGSFSSSQSHNGFNYGLPKAQGLKRPDSEQNWHRDSFNNNLYHSFSNTSNYSNLNHRNSCYYAPPPPKPHYGAQFDPWGGYGPNGHMRAQRRIQTPRREQARTSDYQDYNNSSYNRPRQDRGDLKFNSNRNGYPVGPRNMNRFNGVYSNGDRNREDSKRSRDANKS